MTAEEIEALLELEKAYGSVVMTADAPALARTALDALAEVERLTDALLSLPAVYARQINTGVREVYDPLQRFYRMEDVLHALIPKGPADDRA